MSVLPGTRCRSTRPIVFPGGIVRRATPGTLVSQRENLGRELFTVDFDSGQTLILFSHEIELVRDDLAQRAGSLGSGRNDRLASAEWL